MKISAAGLKAIEKGKEWMRNSVNHSHDYRHAENVAHDSLKVLESLREEGWKNSSKIDEEIVLVVAWWHDCYKALHSKEKIYVEFFEGIGSAKIVKRELEKILSGEELNQVLSAIRWHNNFLYFLLAGRKLPLLTRVLMEADAIEAHNPKRKDKSNVQKKKFVYISFVDLVEPILNSLQSIYIKSPYAKIKIKEFKKNEFKTKHGAKKSSRA
jgi:hypothetical protein